jgi:hypothetical protein
MNQNEKKTATATRMIDNVRFNSGTGGEISLRFSVS